MAKKPPVAPAASVRRMKNGRWQYKATGRIAPTVNGRPLPAGWKKDKRGRPYNVQARREQAIRNFGTTRERGKAPAQTQSLAARYGLVLWKGPPAPRYKTVYMATSERDRLAGDDSRKRAALTRWCNEHAIPSTKRPASERGSHLLHNRYAVTVSRHAQVWTTLVLAWFPDADQWEVESSNPITDRPDEAVENGIAALELPPSSPEYWHGDHDAGPSDRTSVSIPLRYAGGAA